MFTVGIKTFPDCSEDSIDIFFNLFNLFSERESISFLWVLSVTIGVNEEIPISVNFSTISSNFEVLIIDWKTLIFMIMHSNKIPTKFGG